MTTALDNRRLVVKSALANFAVKSERGRLAGVERDLARGLPTPYSEWLISGPCKLELPHSLTPRFHRLYSLTVASERTYASEQALRGWRYRGGAWGLRCSSTFKN